MVVPNGKLPLLMALGLAVSLAACSTRVKEAPVEVPGTEVSSPNEAPVSSETGADDSVSDKSEEPAPQPDPGISNEPALVSLADKAESYYRNGDYNRAIATAERGLRIDRYEVTLYLVLARSYLQLNNLSQAHSFARQGLSYVQAWNTAAKASLRRILEVQ